MKVLIVESDRALAQSWDTQLTRARCAVSIATSEEEACDLLLENSFDVIVLDLVLSGGGALSVADIALLRRPETRVIFVTNTDYFSDGSIFRHFANACAFLPTNTQPADLAAMVEHFARQ